MRLNVILIAAAMLLPTLPLFSTGAAQGGASLEIASPEEGGALARDGFVTLVYRHQPYSVQGHVNGTLLLDGEQVAQFSRPLNLSDPNGTRIVVQVDATAVAGGNRTLVAHAQEAPPSTTPPVNATRNVVLADAETRPPEPERLSILSPSAGDTIETRDLVRLHYARPDARAGTLAGFIALNGTIVGTFARSFDGTSLELSVRLEAPGSLVGARTLSAHAWLDDDPPVAADEVTVEIVPYNAPPQVRILSANYSNDANAFRVVGKTSDPDGHVAALTLLTPFGNLTRTSPDSSFTLLVAADPPMGSWSFTALVVDDGGKQATAEGLLVRVNEPPRVLVHNASHLQGVGYRISGHVADRDGHIEALQVTLGPRTWTWRNATGDWSFDLADVPARGVVRGEVVTWDDQRAITRVPIEVEVVGVPRVLYERTIDLNLGAHANYEAADIPPRIRDGTIEVCGVDCTLPYLGTAVLVKHHDSVCSPGLPVPAQECRFENPWKPTRFGVAWAQVLGDATVRISGWEV